MQAYLPLQRGLFSRPPECLMLMLLWSLEWPPALRGTWGGNSPDPWAHVGSLAPHQITTDFLYPLALPAECLSASDEDSTSGTEAATSSSKSSRSEPDEVHPLPQIFRTWVRTPCCMSLTRTCFLWPGYTKCDFPFQGRSMTSHWFYSGVRHPTGPVPRMQKH